MTLETGLLTAILVLVFLSLVTRRGDNSAPWRSLDRKLDLILTNLGIDPLAGLDTQLAELVRSGRKIEAIKLYRQASGVGLKDAKEYVEGL